MFFYIFLFAGNPDRFLYLDLSSCFENSTYLNLVAYQKDMYPYGAIGPVKILYSSNSILTEMNDEANGKLVVLCHPAIATQVLKQLENWLQQSNHQGEQLIFKHHRLDFVIFKLTGRQSTTILHNVIQIHADYSSQESIWKHKLFRCYANDVMNIYVKDPRLHIPMKKKNPLLNQIPNGEPISSMKAFGSNISN